MINLESHTYIQGLTSYNRSGLIVRAMLLIKFVAYTIFIYFVKCHTLHSNIHFGLFLPTFFVFQIRDFDNFYFQNHCDPSWARRDLYGSKLIMFFLIKLFFIWKDSFIIYLVQCGMFKSLVHMYEARASVHTLHTCYHWQKNRQLKTISARGIQQRATFIIKKSSSNTNRNCLGKIQQFIHCFENAYNTFIACSWK